MKFGKLFLVTLFVSVWQPAWADSERKPGLQKKLSKDSVSLKLDSAFTFPERFFSFSELIPNEPDEVIQDRLSCIKSSIPLTFNPFVRSYVDYFTIRNRKYTRRMLERENLYFPLFEKYLKKHNMPEELKYLAVVESALNPKAKSHVGALGLWQFMPATGGDFKLVQNAYYDERMDPEKSTEAACKFLRQLHNMFGDWELALAAYNCGPGNVRKAIAKAGGGKQTFWAIFPYLPKETRGYVPSFTAVMYAMNYAGHHKITSDSLQFAIATDTVLLNQGIDLAKFSAELNMSPEALKNLNPSLKKDYLPETVRNFAIKVPAEKRPILAQNRSTILDNSRYFSPKPVQPKLTPQEPEPVMIAKQAPEKQPDSSAESLQKLPYTVKRGDFLGKIAKEHNVTVEDLKTWNNLKSTNVMVNQKLVIHQPAVTDSAQTTALASAEVKTTEETVAETKPAPVQIAKASPVKKTVARKVAPKAPIIIHSVQPGDTLWNISKKYEGITVEEIKKKNNLKTNELKPGQKLVIS
ncbi:LysM peptidoglycan-binding domain-containing protein [Adhaeribacter sp. BT258]|uniref:LysM peptidoglycan-binding domain-containing protein n=1 Tax=Adhaeribacter terrigena TaxID=2793070 RepID=A0ABS1BXE3_9BACT|nr:lytic transglycosylase domain-containing protein [Adhaeribacter terrigena]MBK0401586.1 LysM peptidoglycan-binding domain-containing protein [Adhaeribacter terrigena]